MRPAPPERNALYATLRRWPLAAAVLLIALATLVPVGNSPPRFLWRLELADVAVNLALYLPLGLTLAWSGFRARDVAILTLLCSGTIELAQGLLLNGRRGSPADVAANLAGALFGALLWNTLAHAARSPRAGARTLATAALSLPAAAWLLSALALPPDPPRTPTWYSLWAHHLFGTEPFTGTLLEVRLQGRPAPDGWLYDAPARQADARLHGLRLDVTFLSSGPTEGPTQLASIADMREHTLIGLEQTGDDLMLFWESRGSRHRLRPPRVTFAHAARAARGERLTIHATITSWKARVDVEREGAPHSAALRLTPLTGWRSFIPSRDLSAGSQRLFDVVWTLGLAGYLIVAFRVLRSFRLSY